MPNLKPSIPYPSRRDNKRRRDQANEQIEKFYEIFKEMSFKISFTDALMLMPKFASTLKALIGNKEKLSEMARTPMNEHCSAVILNKHRRTNGSNNGLRTGVSDSDWVTVGWTGAATPLWVEIPFKSSLGLVTVLPGSVPDPEDDAVLALMNLDIISVRLANWFCTV
uniref:Reverse transcriptase domain-containing protein n=1 Tax=Tanacetum cinerariifolium TaxID=118510 RepID=A0A699J2M0_TANCI|nr:reverse transcriptase domain-containing protein [Tanacetum cinerariifolium]